MKKLIVIAALIAISAQAAAFWGWNDNRGYGNGYSNGVVDGVGNADAGDQQGQSPHRAKHGLDDAHTPVGHVEHGLEGD